MPTSTQIEFYVSKGEQTLGPWTMDEIAARLARAEIAVTDFVYEDTRADWVPIMDCSALKERLHKSKPKAPPPRTAAPMATATAAKPTTPARTETTTLESAFAGTETTAPTETPIMAAVDTATAEWFVQKGNDRYGPFTYLGLVKALQEKSIYEFDFVWKNGMDRWIRLAEHEDFRAEKIRDLRGKVADSSGVFSTRRHPRIPFDSEVIVHDNRTVWMGRSFQGSAGGSGLMIENAALVPGQVVLLHFAASEDLPAFNALCEIVSKKFTKDARDKKAPVNYSVRFLKMDASAEPKVQEYFKVRGNKAQATKVAA
jgi:hypothetical protein